MERCRAGAVKSGSPGVKNKAGSAITPVKPRTTSQTRFASDARLTLEATAIEIATSKMVAMASSCRQRITEITRARIPMTRTRGSRFVLGWKHLGYEERLQAQIVSYADDFVICCGHGAEQALTAARQIMTKLKLTINEAKTRVCRLPEESFDFLGYSIGRCYSTKTGKAYLGTTPSKKRVQRICRDISEATRLQCTQQDAQAVVKTINRKLLGWSNYFFLGPKI